MEKKKICEIAYDKIMKMGNSLKKKNFRRKRKKINMGDGRGISEFVGFGKNGRLLRNDLGWFYSEL